MGEELKQHVISGCGYKHSCKDLDKAKDGARSDFAKEIDAFLIKTSTEDDTVRLRKLNDWMRKEKELHP